MSEAVITPTTDDRGQALSEQDQRGRSVTVEFNPDSLDLTLTNSIRAGRGARAVQTVSQATAKLSMELQFDTTTSGDDVRWTTQEIASMADPVQQSYRRRGQRRTRKVPAIVRFEWGTMRFDGYIDNYRERLDFFSEEGIPLRATVTLSLTQQERDFDLTDEVDWADTEGVLNLPQNAGPGQKGGTAGNAAASRCLGASNGLENLRLAEVSQLSLGMGASGQAALGLGASASVFASAGSSAGISSSVGISATTGAGAGIGAVFGGLRTGGGSGCAGGTGGSLSAGAGIAAGAEFGAGVGAGLGGDGNGELTADVGLNSHISFDGD